MMSEDQDKKWLDSLTERYIWPEPNFDLKQKILDQASLSEYSEAVANWDEQNLFKITWNSALAVFVALALGFFVGGLGDIGASESNYSSIYTDSDLMFVQSIVDSNYGEGERG